MNAYKFVKENGLEKAKAVVEGAPEGAIYYWEIPRCEQGVYSLSEINKSRSIDVAELKQAIADFELIESQGGMDFCINALKSVENEYSEYGSRLGTKYKKSSDNPDDLALMLIQGTNAFESSRHYNFELDNGRFFKIRAVREALQRIEQGLKDENY